MEVPSDGSGRAHAASVEADSNRRRAEGGGGGGEAEPLTAVLVTYVADGTMIGEDRARDRRSGSSKSREFGSSNSSSSSNNNTRSRIKSRSVSPGYSAASRHHGMVGAGGRPQDERRRSGSGELPGSSFQHDYVNSAPKVLGMGTGYGGAFDVIPAIPPPPQKQQQSFNRQQQHLIDIDSDPYGKEFDAISTDSSRFSAAAAAAGSRINGRVAPPAHQQQQQRAVDERKEFVPPRLRNGFVERAAAWPHQGSAGGDV